ncbi:hypothetical protein BZA05DRAFT_472682 [Tricharina praecox]|uniref:uncharacterized protein n=1 Tax=Tricharina praecox TaxID=43433 RepID=UPI002220B68B|nr:uncharacterized protein BZA05DRAFT_472682 [Tricharina praecox]KAI5854890.1 hypothetical protein BZA05DRAFT_472682 [Tricharina praecox]
MLYFQIIIATLAAVAAAIPSPQASSTAVPSPEASSAPTGPPAGMPEIPQCLSDCFLPAIKKTECKMGEGPTCLCADEEFTSGMLSCVTSGCEDKTVIAKFTEMSAKGCEKYGGGKPAGF